MLHRRQRPPRSDIQPAKSLPNLSRIPISNDESDLKGTPSILGMREWLDELGHSVLVCQSWCELILMAAGCRSQQPEHYSRRWNQRERKHMCIHWFVSKSSREENWVSMEGWPLYLTTSHLSRREDSDQFWTAFERSICKVLLRDRWYTVAIPPSGIRGQAPLSPIICIVILSRLYQGRRWYRHIWDSPWRRVWLYKCHWETRRYSHHNTWNRSY